MRCKSWHFDNMITRRLTSCLAFFIGMLLTASVHIRGKEAVVDTPNFDSKKNATTSVGSESLSLKRRQPSGRTTIIFGTGKIDDEEKTIHEQWEIIGIKDDLYLSSFHSLKNTFDKEKIKVGFRGAFYSFVIIGIGVYFSILLEEEISGVLF